MKALRIHGIKDVRVDTVDDPIIEESRDAIIRVTSTAICGSDLHLYNGGFPQPRPMTLGHEFMGIVEEVGKGVTNLKRGDRVVVPFPIACGGCFFCNHDLPGHCENSNPEHYGPEGGVLKEKGGGLFGFGDLYGGYNGGQAEYVRVPYADYGPRKVPDSLNDDQVLFLTDIFPTGYSAIDWANVQGGETVVIFGAGPVGIMAAKSAWLRGAARVINVDTQQYRLDKAKQAANSEGILWNSHDQVIEEIRNMTDGRGADVCVEAVGFEPDRDLIDRAKAVINLEKGSAKVLEACFSAVRRGGVVSVVGIYSVPYDNFPIGQFFEKGFSIVGGQALVHKHIDKLLEHVVEGRVKLDDVITHRLSLDDAVNGYDIFRNKKDNCVKVVLKP
jgi:threonine dehydrogenase-like Zn-dependent dehydrogenase